MTDPHGNAELRGQGRGLDVTMREHTHAAISEGPGILSVPQRAGPPCRTTTFPPQMPTATPLQLRALQPKRPARKVWCRHVS